MSMVWPQLSKIAVKLFQEARDLLDKGGGIISSPGRNEKSNNNPGNGGMDSGAEYGNPYPDPQENIQQGIADPEHVGQNDAAKKEKGDQEIIPGNRLRIEKGYNQNGSYIVGNVCPQKRYGRGGKEQESAGGNFADKFLKGADQGHDPEDWR